MSDNQHSKSESTDTQANKRGSPEADWSILSCGRGVGFFFSCEDPQSKYFKLCQS